MATYPQIAQFPVLKRKSHRTITNHALDGRIIKLSDPGINITEWQLQYTDLADDELALILDFFSAAEGIFGSFTFVDPLANLLAWSEQLEDAVWEKGPFLSLTEAQDPLGTNRAWRIHNSGAGSQTIQQQIAIPDSYLCVSSAYVRSGIETPILFLSQAFSTFPQWRRVAVNTQGRPTFDLELPAGGDIEVFGFQAEAQLAPSRYKRTTARTGMYENARFRENNFTFTTTDSNRHSCRVNIIHANHI
jgi:hypothetical protein